MSALAAARSRLRRRRFSRGRPRPRISRQRIRLTVAATILCALLLGGGWFLVRDSSLVAVDHVTVTGTSGGDAGAIRSALDAAARRMTTLNVDTSRLRAAVSGFPEVRSVRVNTDFPHGLAIHVIELLPVGAVRLSGREVGVTGDGTLLPRVSVSGSLPLIALDQPATGARLHERWALSATRLLAAAPRRLLFRLADVTTVAGHGLVAQIRSGPSVYFGDASQAQAKWAALLAVLASPSSAGALYIDVTDPARPAAGAGQSAADAAGIGSAAAMGSAVVGASTAGSTATGSPSSASSTAAGSPSGPSSTAAGSPSGVPTGG